MSERIKKHWRSYLEKVVPADADVIQREECRRAFYAGAAAMYTISLDEIATITDSEAAEREMKEIDRELKSFVDEIRYLGRKS